jgi:pentatricopeptide repeat protein
MDGYTEQKHGEARRGREGGRSPALSPMGVATPSRGGRSGEHGGRSGERRERTATALEEVMRKQGVDEAWNSLEVMQGQGIQTDKYTISRMLMKTVGDGRSRMNPPRIYRAIALVEKFVELQPKDVDEVLLNALLDTCCRLKDLTRLESIMQRMRDLKITASPVTLGILVKTYGQAGDIQKVLQVWEEMEKQRGQANAVTFGCMIDACVKCNRLDKAVEIFKGMRESGKHRNTILYTTLIKGYGLDKDLNSALELFREMPRENVPYNTITYNSIIDACVKGGELATAESLLREITAPTSPLEPDLITFSTLLKGYCHAGELDKALQLAECIKSRGLRCDELVYNTLMDGCVKANDVTAGVGLFEEMVHNGMRPSAITHSILTRLYQRAGYEEDASEAVSQLYQHHGIERPTGGDRGKGAGRHHREHYGRGANRGSPTASPMSGYGMHQDQGGWSNWGEAGHGYESYGDQSAASTPCGSPHHQIGGNANGVFLPMDAMRPMPPPFPGMGGSDYASSCAGQTPMGSGYGSYMGSPCNSPTAMDQQQCQGQMMASQVQYQGGMMSQAPSGSGMPSLPAFPFAGQTVPCFPQSTAPAGMDTSVPQFYQMPMPQGVAGTMPAMSPAMGNMMPPQNMGGASPISLAPGGPLLAWQGQPAETQQSPFPMPLSPPHDLAQNCAPGQSVPQQPQQRAYFEMMPDSGQAVVGQDQAGAPNPFCL